MGGSITVRSGNNAAYYSDQMAGPEHQGASEYYLSATEKQGEPVGTYLGEGLADLGIHDGDKVEPEVFKTIYGEFVNPVTGEYLGSPPRVNAQLRALFNEKRAAEPGLTKERERELWLEARAEVPSAGVQFYDTTVSVDKTISLAHASALAKAREAREAGDLGKSAEWEARAAAIWAGIEGAVRVWVDYAQSESRYVRTGHHGRKIDWVQQGKFEDAQEIPVVMFPQHVNRNGEIHLHVHVLWLNRVQTVSDGKWRALDGRHLYRVRGAGSSIAHLSLETALSARYGFDWVYRPASRGRVIEGVSDKAIRAFSSRRAEISKTTLGLIDAYEARYGHVPDRRAVWSMSQHAHKLTRQPKGDERLDFGKLLDQWDATSREAELGSLTELAAGIWDLRGQAERHLREAGELTPKAERELMLRALADAQSKSAVFSRETLIHRLGEGLPNYVVAAGSDHARDLLEGLADRILAGEGGDRVHCLTAGDFPRVPDCLRRRSGESVYRSPGSKVYATESQLTLEQRIVAQAQAETATRLTPERSAELLGADLDKIEAQLFGAEAGGDEITGSSLRMDQAALVHHLLTSRRRGEVGVALAGAGKTYAAGRAADAWHAAGIGRVIGVTLSSAARDELAKVSPHIEGFNSAQLFGDLPGKRGARGNADIGPNALIIVDEASVEDLQRYGQYLDLAEEADAKIVFLGDIAQLSAPEGAGGLHLLARKLGYAQVQEAVRFNDPWQRSASVALRAGDIEALAEYDAHARLHGGTFEEMAEKAARAYAIDLTEGRESLLLANSNDDMRELSRRVQAYLKEWGKLGDEPAELRESQHAYAGDKIMLRQNLRTSSGEILNGTVLTVREVGADGGLVAVHQDGREFELDRAYLTSSADLGYSATWMTSQGKTVEHSAHSLVPSTATRNGLYESMTRSRQANHGYFYERDEDCLERSGDPEVGRQRVREAEQRGEVVEHVESGDPIALAARVLARVDEPMSATETRERSLSNADHMAVLWWMWNDQYRAETSRRYEAEVRSVLEPEVAKKALRDTDDLFRALRHAELAGQDAGDVLREAVRYRDFEGARSVPAVLASRVREATEGIPAVLRDSWADKVPELADKERQEFMGKLASAMDARQVRLGQHTAETMPVWAREALGELPEAGDERDAWIEKAGKIAATRELLGWDHPGRALGPRPGTTSPEHRAVWEEGLNAMDRVDGVDVRHMGDGLLFVRRDAFERETSWAPADVTEELRVLRMTRDSERIEAARLELDALAARKRGDELFGILHDQRRAERMGVVERCDELLGKLEPTQETRRQWEAVTAETRRVAMAADLELKRRGLLEPDDQMKSGEPEALVPGGIDDENREATIRETLGIERENPELAARIEAMAERTRMAQAKLEQMRSLREEDAEYEPVEAWGDLLGREREAVLQPPERYVPASPEIEAEVEPGAY